MLDMFLLNAHLLNLFNSHGARIGRFTIILDLYVLLSVKEEKFDSPSHEM